MEEKELLSLELGFENVEGIIINSAVVARAILGNITENMLIQEKRVTRFINIDELTIIFKKDLFSEANLSFEDMHFQGVETNEELIETFREHLTTWKDIASIDLVYNDGKKESFSVPWSDEDENTNYFQRFYEKAGEFYLKIGPEKE